MKKTKEQRLKLNIRNNKGITLISLIITIVVMMIIASITVNSSMGRFEINKYKKLINDIELLQEKIESYYLRYGGLPILRNTETNEFILYNLTISSEYKNPSDTGNYYIIDLEAMENLALNYGKGFENYTNPEEKDLYIINEGSHTIYYVKGISLSGITYHYIESNEQEITDNIPPTKPQINILSGTQNEEGIYTAPIELEFVPGKDNWSGVDMTTYSINGGAEEDISNLDNNIYPITEEGEYTIALKCYDKNYDKNGQVSEYIETIKVKEKLPMPKVAVNQKATQNSTINGQMYSWANPIIPAGFAPINITGTHASNWNATNLAEEIKKGLVITDNTTTRDSNGNTVGNEFVWIPVDEINDMVMCQAHGASITLDKETLQCPECDEDTKLAGKLYAKSTGNNYSEGTTGQTYSANSGLREPANLSTTFDNTSKIPSWTPTLYQDKFNDMVESVAEYGGFYVGRYETSLSGSIAQSKAGQLVINSMNWHKIYINSETYVPASLTSEESTVVPEMIWGCQWDAMMRLIGQSRAKAQGHVSHESAYFTTEPYATGGTDYNDVYTKKEGNTGFVAYNDIASNIYDLEGNIYEYTQEAYDTSSRVNRGRWL